MHVRARQAAQFLLCPFPNYHITTISHAQTHNNINSVAAAVPLPFLSRIFLTVVSSSFAPSLYYVVVSLRRDEARKGGGEREAKENDRGDNSKSERERIQTESILRVPIIKE